MIPAGHYRPGRLEQVDLLVLHTAEGARNVDELARFFATTDKAVSAHSAVDDTRRRDLLGFQHTAYAAPGANADGEHLELCGFARWTRSEWLTHHPGMLEQTAHWLAERCKARGIPAVALGPAELRADRRGITTHHSVSLAFRRSSHTDPGPGFPLDVVVARTKALLTPHPTTASKAVPRYPGRPLTMGSRGAAVSLWQRRMRQRGWAIAVDGVFGNESAGVARKFQAEKKLPREAIVGPKTWAAAWTARVT